MVEMGERRSYSACMGEEVDSRTAVGGQDGARLDKIKS